MAYSLAEFPPPRALLGPTNTGKTWFAIERMLSHRTGAIGFPLRLLAREAYDKVVARVGAAQAALVTGEEKIAPASARYWLSTVEAMPLDREVEFLAIDECQMAADRERGRVFTARLLGARGTEETLFLGAETMRPALRGLFPGIAFETRERLSSLAWAGPRKVTRLPRRSAVVGFSADTVYAVAELVRRQRGGAAIVMGALSPRTRNAQAALYQSGDVDFLVATDAIGMGLNMDIDHVAFAARRKFDGRGPRDLKADELAQIAGRAGRHLRDGAFGTTAACPAFDEETVEAIETHRFDPVAALQWRSERLDFSSVRGLREALAAPPPHALLRRAEPGEDERALDALAADPEIAGRAAGVAAVALLWDVCQVPDFARTTGDAHRRLLAGIYAQLVEDGRIAESWFAPRAEALDRVDGDVDALSARLAHVRTWTYLSHRARWTENAAYWQERTRSIENRLSDALHERLTRRFVDRRTAVLMRKLKGDGPLAAGVTADGEVIVEGQFVGRLYGFDFIVDPRARGLEAKQARAAAERALGPVLATRAAALAGAAADELSLDPDGAVRWRGATVARLEKGPAPLRPELRLAGLDAITPALRGRVRDRLVDFLTARIEGRLADLVRLKAAVDGGETANGALTPAARGIGYRLLEHFGAMSRAPLAGDLKALGQAERASLRALGVRFGEYTLFMPALLKPGPAALLAQLWALWAGVDPAGHAPPRAGLVSIPVEEGRPAAWYYACGYRPSGVRAVRIDMLERLARAIRTAREAPGTAEGFEAGPAMMSPIGCSGAEFDAVMESLGFEKRTVQRPAPAPEAASETPAAEAPPAGEPGADAAERATAESARTSDDETRAVEATAPQPGETDAATTDSPASNAPETQAPESGAAAADSAATAAAPAAAEPPTPAGAPETVDVVLWRWKPKRPPRPAGPRRDAGSGAARPDGPRRSDGPRHSDGPHRSGAPRPKKGPPRKGGPRPDREAPRRFQAGPPRRSGPDPDSPFAVLAALKADLSADKGPPDKGSGDKGPGDKGPGDKDER